jgi:hypothetical protein
LKMVPVPTFYLITVLVPGHIHAYTNTYTNRHTYNRMCVHLRKGIHVHILKHILIQYMYIYTYVHIQYIYEYVYVYIYSNTYFYSTYTYIHTYTYMYIHLYSFSYLYLYLFRKWGLRHRNRIRNTVPVPGTRK